jgi:transposase
VYDSTSNGAKAATVLSRSRGLQWAISTGRIAMQCASCRRALTTTLPRPIPSASAMPWSTPSQPPASAGPVAPGRPGSAPGDLLPLSRSGYLYCRRASRRLEQAGPRNVELLGLVKTRRPDHKTMAIFRQNTLEPLRHVCRTCTLRWKQRDLCGAERVAIDGSKCRAVNAKARTVTQDKLRQRIVQSAAPIAAARQELDRSDTAAGTGGVPTPQCPRNNGGRRMTRGVAEPLWEAMAPRGRSRPEGMKRRKTRVEHPGGTRKRGGTRATFDCAGWRRGGRSAVGRSWRPTSGGC